MVVIGIVLEILLVIVMRVVVVVAVVMYSNYRNKNMMLHTPSVTEKPRGG